MRPLRIGAALALDIEEIDSQHQELADLVNQALEILGQGSQPVRLVRILDQFNELAIRHFCTEEILMSEARYPGYMAHRHMHDSLIEKTFAFDASCLWERGDGGRELVALMRSWLLDHIEADREMADFLRQHLA